MTFTRIQSANVSRGLLYTLSVALLATLLATLARGAFDPMLGDDFPSITYFLAVFLSAWAGGRVAGIAATVASALVANYFFVAPRYAISFGSHHARVTVMIFLAFAAVLVATALGWRRTRAALLRAQAVLAQAGEMSHLGAWVVEYSNRRNGHANPLYWSDETYRIFGYQPRSVPVTNDLFFSMVHPDDRAAVAEAVSRAMAEKRPYSFEHRIVRPDGAERILHEHADIDFDARGRPRRMVGAVHDITERRQAEQTIRASEERARRHAEEVEKLMQVVPAAIWLSQDPECRTITGNLAANSLSGAEGGENVSPSQAERGVKTRFFRDGVELPPEALPMQEAASKGVDVRNSELQVHMPSGRTMTLLGNAAPLLDPGGEVRGCIGAFMDITQRKQLEEELRRKADQLAEANRLKDEFIATVSHELRTPLNAMLGWAELLRERRLAPGPAQDRALAAISNNARRQAQLIEDLLDMSRIVAGKLRLDPRLIDTVPPVQAAIEAVLPSVEARGIVLRTSTPDESALVLADAARLQQVVWNLLTNAVKFTPLGGSIAVEVRVKAARVEISVQDSGVGIRPEFLPHVFDRFRQADGGATRSHGGLGIGLSIVRHLVEAQGGQVRAESAGEGDGATFVVTLPLQALGDRGRAVAPHERRPAAGSPIPVTPPRLDGVRVLTVDDEPDARELTSTLLRHHGAVVTAAESAREALELLSAASPDVLLIDIAMPDVDGYTLLRMIRGLEDERARIPALALTAYAREEDRRLALACGFQLHLAKPVEEAALVRAIASTCRASRREADLGAADKA